MKIEELNTLLAAKKASPKPPDDEGPELDYYPEEDDASDNLTEALLQLEECWSFLDGLCDHFKSPRALMTPFMRRELTKVTANAVALLLQYNMKELRGEDETIDKICTG